MAIPPSARGRKNRLVREGESVDDLLLVIRATPTDPDGAVAEMAEDAELSGRQYVVGVDPGPREVLYGVSVFAHRSGVDIAVVVDRFTGAPSYLEVAVGDLRASGFAVHATGTNPDHFDIQLIAGVDESDPEVPTSELQAAAARVLAIGGPLRPNPSYAGGAPEARQEDR